MASKLNEDNLISEMPTNILTNPNKMYKKLIHDSSEKLNKNQLKIVFI